MSGSFGGDLPTISEEQLEGCGYIMAASTVFLRLIEVGEYHIHHTPHTLHTHTLHTSHLTHTHIHTHTHTHTGCQGELHLMRQVIPPAHHHRVLRELTAQPIEFYMKEVEVRTHTPIHPFRQSFDPSFCHSDSFSFCPLADLSTAIQPTHQFCFYSTFAILSLLVSFCQID